MRTDVLAAPAGAAARPPRLTGLAATIFGNHLIWPLLALVFLVGGFVPGFVSGQNLLNTAWSAAPLACMTLGLFFVMLTSGLDLSLESTFALAPTLGILVVTSWMTGLPALAALPVVLLVGAVVGLVNGVFSVKLGVNPFLVTLGTLLALRGVVIYLIPEGVYDLPPAITALGGGKLGALPVAIVAMVVLVLVGYLITDHTPFGKAVFAIGNNEQAAIVAGINVQRIKITTFVLAGLFAAIGGLLQVGRLDSVTADMGDGQILMVFAAATLGGTALSGGEGRVTGILGAALVIACIDNVMNLVGVDPSIRQIAFGLILLVAIYLASLQDRVLKAVRR